MHLLDSDTLSHLWAKHERVVDRLRRCEDAESGTRSITKCEIMDVARMEAKNSEAVDHRDSAFSGRSR